MQAPKIYLRTSSKPLFRPKDFPRSRERQRGTNGAGMELLLSATSITVPAFSLLPPKREAGLTINNLRHCIQRSYNRQVMSVLDERTTGESKMAKSTFPCPRFTPCSTRGGRPGHHCRCGTPIKRSIFHAVTNNISLPYLLNNSHLTRQTQQAALTPSLSLISNRYKHSPE